MKDELSLLYEVAVDLCLVGFEINVARVKVIVGTIINQFLKILNTGILLLEVKVHSDVFVCNVFFRFLNRTAIFFGIISVVFAVTHNHRTIYIF